MFWQSSPLSEGTAGCIRINCRNEKERKQEMALTHRPARELRKAGGEKRKKDKTPKLSADRGSQERVSMT